MLGTLFFRDTQLWVQRVQSFLLGSGEIRSYCGLQATIVTGCWAVGGRKIVSLGHRWWRRIRVFN